MDNPSISYEPEQLARQQIDKLLLAADWVVQNKTAIGTYPLSEKNVAWYDDLDVSVSNGWKADSFHDGSITIKLDEATHRVTGSFSFKAKYDLSDDVVNITKGQFSLVN